MFTLRVPNHEADVVTAAIDAEVGVMIDDAIGNQQDMSRTDMVESRGGWAAIKADAVVALINGTSRTTEVLPTNVELIVDCDHSTPDEHDHIDLSASAEAVVAGRSVAPAIGHRLCCDPRIAVLVEDSRGTVLGSGRQTRLVNRRLRRALERRDRGCCRFPGCAAQRRLHAHHIIHWADGGPTELENLILVCSFHHHVLHEGGWNVDRLTHAFIDPNGVTVDPCPTKRFRGSARTVRSIGSFTGPAPLAEAANEPFDLGLVLEGLAFSDTESLAKAEATRQRWQPRTSYGPPLPTELKRERLVAAEQARSHDFWQNSSSTHDQR